LNQAVLFSKTLSVLEWYTALAMPGRHTTTVQAPETPYRLDLTPADRQQIQKV